MPQTETQITDVSWRDYFELCKPSVVALMILTSLIGMLLATDQMVSLDVLVLGNLGIALCAGSAAAVNHIVDRQIDDKMARTHNRPVARGRIQPHPGNPVCPGYRCAGYGGAADLYQPDHRLADPRLLHWLRLYLHHVSQARHATEYCYWWPGRCRPSCLAGPR